MNNIAEICGLSRMAGGLYFAISALSKEMQGRGSDICVYGRMDAHVDEDRIRWGAVQTRPYQAFGPLQFSNQLRRMLKEDVPDLVHQHGIWLDDQWAASQWQRKTGRPLVISPHGMLDPWALSNSALKKKLVGRLFADRSLQDANCIHALCQSEAESIRSFGLTNPIAVIPNGVSLPELTETKEPGDRKKILFLGRIHPKKGIEELLKAWCSCATGKEWSLVIAGWDDGGHEAGLTQLAQELGGEQCIEFIGPKHDEEKDRLFRSVDAFILPSFSEGLPVTILEAWAYGLPVIMTDYCNLPEGFDAGAAIRVEPESSSIAVGLNTAFSMSDQTLLEMGENGRDLVERRFSWSKIAGDMNAVYDWCLGGEIPSVVTVD